MSIEMNITGGGMEFRGKSKWFDIGILDADDEVCFEMYDMDSTVAFYLTTNQVEEVIKHLQKQINPSF